MKYLFLLAVLPLFISTIKAQKKHKIFFNSYNSVGFVAGKLPVTFAAQTENGIKYKNWFAGGGVGIDLYFVESLPLFAAFKKQFSYKNNKFFLYANTGGNIITKNKTIVGFFSTVTTRGGFYGDAGVGYKIKTSQTSSIFFSLGNTLKKIHRVEASSDNLGMPWVSYTHFNFNRIAFKAGFQF